MTTTNEYCEYGVEVVERSGELVTAISYNSDWGPRYELGQVVYSNGRLWFARGHMGIVTALREPGTPGFTNNLIGVWFVGAQQVSWMKPKDLLPPEQ